MSYRVGVVCDIGAGADAGGRSRNEDSYLICHENRVRYLEGGAEVGEDQPGDNVLVVVCDGMGGHDDGHVASNTACRVMAKLYQPGVPSRPARILLKYVLECHQQLHQAAAAEGPVTMGTTLTAAWLVNGKAAWAHVGDSRMYLFRNGRIFRLTSDHTRLEFARRDGRALPVDGEHLAQNFIYGSRGLGNNANLRLEAGLDSGAEVLHRGDRLLLCSDGVSGALAEDRLVALLGSGDEPLATARGLCDAAIRAGTRDNVTALVVFVDDVPRQEEDDDAFTDADETVQF